MNLTLNSFRRTLAAYALIILPSLAVILTALTCNSNAEESHTPALTFRTSDDLIAKPEAMAPPHTGDTTYIPIAWGAELRVIPGIGVKKSNHKKFGDYWFSKVMAYQIVKPARYLQDSTWERVAFADSVAFGQNDTFYICRRKIY